MKQKLQIVPVVVIRKGYPLTSIFATENACIFKKINDQKSVWWTQLETLLSNFRTFTVCRVNESGNGLNTGKGLFRRACHTNGLSMVMCNFKPLSPEFWIARKTVKFILEARKEIRNWNQIFIDSTKIELSLVRTCRRKDRLKITYVTCNHYALYALWIS